MVSQGDVYIRVIHVTSTWTEHIFMGREGGGGGKNFGGI